MAQDIVGSREPQFASDQLKPAKAGYGQNSYGGASSDLPGEHTESGLAADLRAKANAGRGDGALDRVIATGTRQEGGFQTRNDESSKMLPTTHGMEGAKPGPKIPGSIVSDEGTPARQPSYKTST